MRPDEVEFLESFLNKDTIVLEWGSGQSTLYFSQFVKKWISVENIFYWYKKISEETGENVTVKYSRNPKNYIARADYVIIDKANLVFIDGRKRVACGEKLLRFIDRNTIVLVHDWQRQRYHELKEWYEVVKVVNTLVQLRVK